jgi:hypothetical protein
MSTSVNIPQANSVETLVYIVEAIRDGVDTLEQLALEFQVRDRTIHYYLELAEWLGFLADRKADTYQLTASGARFGAEVDARAELYGEGVRQHDLVVQSLELAQSNSYDDLRQAFIEHITELGVLAEATARRRAGALATLVAATLDDSVDWKTGRIGQPTRMRRTYKATDRAPGADDHAETITWERPRDPVALVGEDRFDRLGELIRDVLADVGVASSSVIRDELALRFGVPLTDPAVFVVLRSGLEAGEWRADAQGRYSLR